MLALQKVWNIVSGRQRAYQLTFADNQATKAVMKDLARFCRANDSTFHENDRAHAVAEGRREVFLRICKHLDLDTRTLLKTMYGVDDG